LMMLIRRLGRMHRAAVDAMLPAVSALPTSLCLNDGEGTEGTTKKIASYREIKV
jgi:hypothetical protein